jgi:hypothetical protein
MTLRLSGLFAVLAVPVRALVVPGESAKPQASLLQTEAEEEADSGATVSMSTLSTQEWKAQRKAAYEEPFTIELDMTAAHDGVAIGADLWSQADTKPLAVQKLGEVGLVEKWNKAHPDKAVQVGDEFIKVGSVDWAYSNKQLVQNLKEQFGALKSQSPGMEKVLEVSFQRPRHSKLGVVSPMPRASLLQTESEEESDSGAMVSMSTLSTEEWKAQRKATYEEPFTIELDMTAAHEGMAIGADLWSHVDTHPLSVQKLGEVGLVEKWNMAHPDKAVQVGDEFIKAGNVEWAFSNKQLVQNLKEQFGSLKPQSPGMEKVLEISFQRPRRSNLPVENPKPRASLLQTEASYGGDRSLQKIWES